MTDVPERPVILEAAQDQSNLGAFTAVDAIEVPVPESGCCS